MGRTLPTAMGMLEMERESWKLFRRALRREDQEAFDELWRAARRQAASAAMAGRALPAEAMFMAMLVALQRRLMDMRRPREIVGDIEKGDGAGRRPGPS